VDTMKTPLILGFLFLLISCGGSEPVQIATIAVQPSGFEIVIPAMGELKARKTTPISIPSQIQRSQTLSWLAPENTFVRKGDVLVRFDPTQYQLKSQDERVEIEKLTIDVDEKGRSLDTDRLVLEGQTFILDQEKTMAKKYAPKDMNIYSKSEIIDSAIDLDYLESKNTYYLWKRSGFEKNANAEMGLLEMQKNGHQLQYDQLQDAMRILELKAPHDGIFIYKKNWRGESLRVGQNVWPGMKIGMLPDMNSLEAKVYVLESEASGLKEGLNVEISLDAHPGYSISGKTTMIAPLAKPKKRRSPVKYFEVNIKLDKLDKSLMRLGNRLKAKIFVTKKENTIAVPNQAVFQENQVSWVYVVEGKGFEKRIVVTGDRSLTRTEITGGLKIGEEIALSKPKLAEAR